MGQRGVAGVRWGGVVEEGCEVGGVGWVEREGGWGGCAWRRVGGEGGMVGKRGVAGVRWGGGPNRDPLGPPWDTLGPPGVH